MRKGDAKRLLAKKGLTRFQIAVLLATMDIPKGETVSYKEIAKRVGRPKAYRAVGSALHRNPFPVRIPCHRVIRSDGGIGGYGSGIEKKAALLRKELPSASL